jgi:hypothetical protein
MDMRALWKIFFIGLTAGLKLSCGSCALLSEAPRRRMAG